VIDAEVFYRVQVKKGDARINVYFVVGGAAIYIGWSDTLTGAINVVARHAA
jgi:hypothetical protein